MASAFLSLKTLASLKVSDLFWNTTFKFEGLNLYDIKTDEEQDWEIRLTSYRNKVICKLNTFMKEGNIPINCKSILKENIFEVYYNYHKMCLWKITYDPYNRINLLENDALYMNNFFTMDCKFNDKLWVKQFVRNENFHIFDRFNMACCFGLETETQTLWSDLKDTCSCSDVILGNFNFFSFFNENSPLITYIILQIEYDIATSEEDWENQEQLWMHAFEFAIEKGYEHAVYYLWKVLPENEQLILMDNNTFFELINAGMEFPKSDIGYFLFSHLSVERKNDLLYWTIDHLRIEIWYVLFFSFNLIIIDEHLIFYEQLTVEMNCCLFTLLAEKIWKQQIPSDMDFFEELWYILGLEEKKYILENGLDLIKNLAKGKSTNCLGCIVKSLTIKQKRECLFYDRYEAGISVLDILCKNKEFDMFQKYLSFFLINSFSKTDSVFNILRSDANIFLETYLNSTSFKALRQKESFKRNENELKCRINSLQTCLTLLNDLCFTCNEFSLLQYFPTCICTLWKDLSRPLDLSLISSLKKKRKFE